ncbi:MAG: hypothetical protein KBF99_13910 [Leptospiraceae bacterium]|nr:hypothetical protein [Leptospiraceae bacterium]MBK7058249.1 hypothetical protein [Leptospiraceae bacterium]MBK9501606.1 hypothetical protein [Leptospiraceae bacterium]MBL0264131.1 hypothetical protein [Leptospiraceae bacterium]MBP9164273.1 hypothetical protein [Leptospiraceae bacterium]
MIQSAKYSTNNLERETWESFEVGSFEDVVDAVKENPSSALLNHLAILAKYELGFRSSQDFVGLSNSGLSVFTPLVNAYIAYYSGNKSLALQKVKEYLEKNNPPLCLIIINFSVKVSFELEAYEDCLSFMDLSLKRQGSNPNEFIKERIECYFQLKKHLELIQYFKSVYKLLDANYDIYLKAGLSLNALGKYQEAQFLFGKIPGKKELPSYDEKKQEFKPIINRIAEFEKKDVLSDSELKDLGFAYLFNSEFKKAEEVFKRVAYAIK